jgi:hypothetical protein
VKVDGPLKAACGGTPWRLTGVYVTVGRAGGAKSRV